MALATFLKINPADSVVVCLAPKKQGDIIEVDGKQITVNQDTPAGHKVLIKDVKEGEDIIKYGYPIGHARQDMKAGDWVNENNLKTNLSGTLEYTYKPVDAKSDINHIKNESRTFKGYVRKNGDVGVRNEIWIVPTVGCVNGIAERAARSCRKTTRTPARYCVTSVCTPMPAVCWCSVWVARTTSPRTSWLCWATTTSRASSCW